MYKQFLKHFHTGSLYLAMMKYCISLAIVFLSLSAHSQTFEERLVSAALERTKHSVRYDGSYIRIDYPGGDVPKNMGVCTDVIIRLYRELDIDLQKLVHEDMALHFEAYPSKRMWGLLSTDKNIDHRRVPNLQTYFSRNGQSLPVTQDSSAYLPGNLVTWMLPGNLPHIGIVTDQKSSDGQPLIVHNIGNGPKLENMLFDYKITGHYRFKPTEI